MKVRITNNRRITLPVRIVKEFQFEKGNFLDIEEIDGNLVLKPAKPNLTQKELSTDTVGAFGALVKILRLKKGLSSEEFAKLVGINKSNWSCIERSNIPPPQKPETLSAIANVLDADPETRQRLYRSRESGGEEIA